MGIRTSIEANTLRIIRRLRLLRRVRSRTTSTVYLTKSSNNQSAGRFGFRFHEKYIYFYPFFLMIFLIHARIHDTCTNDHPALSASRPTTYLHYDGYEHICVMHPGNIVGYKEDDAPAPGSPTEFKPRGAGPSRGIPVAHGGTTFSTAACCCCCSLWYRYFIGGGCST